MATVKALDAVKVLTVRGTAFEPAVAGGAAAAVENMDAAACDASLSQWVSQELSVSDRPDLATADIVVSGGRGLKSGECLSWLDDKLRMSFKMSWNGERY